MQRGIDFNLFCLFSLVSKSEGGQDQEVTQREQQHDSLLNISFHSTDNLDLTY